MAAAIQLSCMNNSNLLVILFMISAPALAFAQTKIAAYAVDLFTDKSISGTIRIGLSYTDCFGKQTGIIKL